GHHPVDRIDLGLVPDHLERHAAFDGHRGDRVPQRNRRNLAILDELQRLGTLGPPYRDAVLDPAEAREGAIDIRRIDFRNRHAIGQQREDQAAAGPRRMPRRPGKRSRSQKSAQEVMLPGSKTRLSNTMFIDGACEAIESMNTAPSCSALVSITSVSIGSRMPAGCACGTCQPLTVATSKS